MTSSPRAAPRAARKPCASYLCVYSNAMSDLEAHYDWIKVARTAPPKQTLLGQVAKRAQRPIAAVRHMRPPHGLSSRYRAHCIP